MEILTILSIHSILLIASKYFILSFVKTAYIVKNKNTQITLNFFKWETQTCAWSFSILMLYHKSNFENEIDKFLFS